MGLSFNISSSSEYRLKSEEDLNETVRILKENFPNSEIKRNPGENIIYIQIDESLIFRLLVFETLIMKYDLRGYWKFGKSTNDIGEVIEWLKEAISEKS